MREYRRRPLRASSRAVQAARQMLATLSRKEIGELLEEGLHVLALEIGRIVAAGMLKDEVERLCGAPYERNSGREATRYGHQPGWVAMAGQKVSIKRPRVRYVGRCGEVPLPVYQLMQSGEGLSRSVLKRSVHGVSSRNYEQVVERVRAGYGLDRSSVSRRFIRATAVQVKRLCERCWAGERFAAIMIDGKSYAGQMMVVVLGITVRGNKHILGLRQGATENAQVCKELLESLRQRGVATDLPTLFVLDGAKALRAAVVSIWGERAVIQRCQVHKRRNVRLHLEQKHWSELDRRLGAAYGEEDYGQALELLTQTVAWLRRINPDAAASLREGLAETLTLARLGIHTDLRKTLSSTNVIESAFSVTEQVTGRVKRWRDGDMRWRWCAAGLLHAEEHFRRVDGYRHLGKLVAALERTVPHDPVDSDTKVA